MDYKNRAVITFSVVSLSALGFLWWYRKNRKEKIPKNWKAVGKVGDLHIYPLKSGRRVELNEAECGKYGMVQINNRAVFKLKDRFLVVYGKGPAEGTYEFKTARTFPKLILIEVSNHDADHVALDAPNMRTLYVKIPAVNQEEIRKILMHAKEESELVDCGDEAAAWLSRYIKGKETGLRLGYHDDNLKDRTVNLNHKELKHCSKMKNDDLGIFSDFTSYMLMTKASMEDLNNKMDKEVSFCQFRPTIFVDEVDMPYMEEKWDWIKIGDEAIFRNVKLCTRCVLTTVNPETGVMDSKQEPLKTLKKYKLPTEEEAKGSNSPVLGIHLGLRKPGIIKLNDTVYINH